MSTVGDTADRRGGMTKEQKKRIFDRFYRANASDTATRGFGLGMSIVKQIIEGHDGMISVDSLPGRGPASTSRGRSKLFQPPVRPSASPAVRLARFCSDPDVGLIRAAA